MRSGLNILIVFLLVSFSFVGQIAFVSSGENGAVDGSTGVYFTVDGELGEGANSTNFGMGYSYWKIIEAVILILIIIFVVYYAITKKRINIQSRYHKSKK